MKSFIVVAVFLIAQNNFAGDKNISKIKTHENNLFNIIHVEDLVQLMDAKKNEVYVFDANNEETRKREGVIAGAKILPSYDNYDIAKELPQNKDAKLVFYCANTQCSASHSAANRASKAGYKDVNVMADGIQGWTKAGKPTSKLGPS